MLKSSKAAKLTKTCRPVRRLACEARQLPAAPAPVKEKVRKTPSVTTSGDPIHINFHKYSILRLAIEVVDPVTKKRTCVARRFDRSDVFYRLDGSLYGEKGRLS